MRLLLGCRRGKIARYRERRLAPAGEFERRPGESSSGCSVAETSSGWTVGALDETLKSEDEPLLCVAPNVGRVGPRPRRHPMVGWAVRSPSLSHCACSRARSSRPCCLYPFTCNSSQTRASTSCEQPAESYLQNRRSLPTLACDAFSAMASVSRADPGAMRCRPRVYAVEPGLGFPVLHLHAV